MHQKDKSIILKRLILAVLTMSTVAVFCACTTKKPDPISAPISSEIPTRTSPTVFPTGTMLAGENISEKSVEQATEIGQSHIKRLLSELEISVKFVEETVQLSGDDFVAKDILGLALPQMLISDNPDEYEIPYVIDISDKGKEKLNIAAKNAYQKAENAGVSEFNFETKTIVSIDAKIGVRVNLATTIKSVRELLVQKHGGAIQAQLTEVKPSLMNSSTNQGFVEVASFSTESTNTENGNQNMLLSLEKINGTILMPGEEFSFNDVVGDSTHEGTGFLPAGGISGGVMVQLYGGGICQTSSTLYGAALRAGLEITLRDCHSIESTYVPTGLDATVDYGYIDFRFKNNTDTPIYIAGSMEGVTLHTTIYGKKSTEWDKVEVYSERTASEPALSDVSFVTDPNLASGEFMLKTSGSEGIYSAASRTFYKGESVVKTEELPSSYYRAKGKVYTVGPNTDTKRVDTSIPHGNVNG